MENEVLPHKKYFREAIQNNPNFSPWIPELEAVPSEVWNTVSSSFVGASGKLQSISDKIVHGQEVHPSEYAELLEDESFVDNIEVNEINKVNFIIFAEYFFQQDINWLLGLGSDSKTKFVKTYLELITGGVISKLAEKLLTAEERVELFKNKINDSVLNEVVDSERELKFNKMKGLIFEYFIKSSDNFDLKEYTTIWNQNFQQKDVILDRNNLNLNTKYFQKLKEFYNKKEYENNTSTYIFNKINTAASPINNEDKIPLQQLYNARKDHDLVSESEALGRLAYNFSQRGNISEAIHILAEIMVVQQIGH